MTKLLLFSFLTIISIAAWGQKREFIQFEQRSARLSDWLQVKETKIAKNDTLSVSAFEMGNFITWKQYKEFLADVKRMKGAYAYEQLLPKLPAQHLNQCLNSNKFDSSPAVGVSWSNANEYCKWRMVVDGIHRPYGELLNISYHLPSQLEWTSAYFQCKESNLKIDLNSNYSDWTRTTYDESMNTFMDYQYNAQRMDPPAMKRKRVLGSSFFNPSANATNNNFGYYQDSSYAHIGFRMVREMNGISNIGEEDLYFGDHFEELWNNGYGEYLGYPEQKTIQANGVTSKFYQDDFRFTGEYESFYSNGKIKSKGLFYENQRVGKWTVWDSLGSKIVERNYVNPYRFQQIFPEIKDEQANILRDAQIISLSRNETGVLNYPYVQERSVIWSKRFWSRIESEGNPQLFRKDRLIDALKLGVESGDIQAYDTNSDQFRDTISASEFTRRLSGKVLAFEMKEDCFYDMDRGISSTRPIGICPIVFDTIDGVAIERKVAWLYSPQTRETLGTIQCFTISDRLIPIHKYQRGGSSNTTLDDLFFFRNFNRKIVGTTSVYGRTKIESESSLLEEIQLIETEHDLWLRFNSGHQ